MPVAVVDTTVLIAFGHLDRLDLLPRLFERVWIPNAVRDEALRDPDYDEVPRIQRAIDAAYVHVVEQDPAVTEASLAGLGAGEAAVITLARALDAVAVLDEQRGRQAARSLSLSVIGTVGLLITARQRGYITSALTLARELRAAGLHLGDDELAAAAAADASA